MHCKNIPLCLLSASLVYPSVQLEGEFIMTKIQSVQHVYFGFFFFPR